MNLKHLNDKYRSKHFRWICVSPYLLLSWLTAGVSIPIVLSIIASNQYPIISISSSIKQENRYSINDLIANQKFHAQSFAKNDHAIFKAFITSHREITLSQKKAFHLENRLALNQFTSRLLSSKSMINHANQAYSSLSFSSHPHIKIYAIVHWLVDAFGIRSRP